MRLSIIGILIFVMSGCVTFAPPSPMITYGGPKTTKMGISDAAIAFGSGMALFEGAHAGGQGWFGRYKYGITDKWDIGIDAIGFSHSDKYTFTTKLAGRYQLLSNLRLEGGIGVADDSEGKSANSDIGLTWGTANESKTWNYYSTLRFGYAKGYPGSVFGGDNQTNSRDTTAQPDAFIGLINVGTQAKVHENITFIFEGGYGYIFPKGHSTGNTFYISCGLLFNIGKEK